jgi:hypothetical protein
VAPERPRHAAGDRAATEDLAAWLLARYDEIERVARAAAGKGAPTWRADDQGEVFAVRDLQDPARCEHHTAGVPNHCDDLPVASGADVTDDAGLEQARAGHIAMHDPAAVLRDVEAKRAIVTEHEHVPTFKIGSVAIGCAVCHRLGEGEGIEANGWCNTMKLLAQPFADRDDFRDQWRL